MQADLGLWQLVLQLLHPLRGQLHVLRLGGQLGSQQHAVRTELQLRLSATRRESCTNKKSARLEEEMVNSRASPICLTAERAEVEVSVQRTSANSEEKGAPFSPTLSWPP